MRLAHVTRDDFLLDPQGRLLADLLRNTACPFDEVLDFFNRRENQVRMVESESIYNRAPAAAVVQDLQSAPAILAFLAAAEPETKKRFGQSVTILVRIVMDRLGWEVVRRAKAT